MTNVILLKNASIPSDPYDIKFSNSNKYKPNFVPLLTHRHKDKSQTLSFLISDEFLNNIPIFIITSQRAVEMFKESTYKILKSVGFKDVRGGDEAGNGSKLADLIKQDTIGRENIPMVFFTGVIRKDIIPRKLIDSGYNNFQEFILYQTGDRLDIIDNFKKVIHGLDKDKDNDDVWIVFFSPQGTKEIVNYLIDRDGNSNQKNWKIASIGPTTRDYLKDFDLSPHVIAPKPDPEALFETIFQYDKTYAL
ncbi:Uroporphyrinogen-III synthase HemD family protein [Candida albicans]|uniref:Uroporphyrinogen-III synthase HemD family protein n=1 Tax=Candida albicans TaxID=5476 RepID=A0A8H6F358_CANAX|nr:Uroporphyrinogen-III synthase HemD family protein [Candida albicans]